ncbi:MAG: DUF58 domain-containing protein [Acidobacteria bacterium]|nr:DUF58 domain-containing protein [Acidobacteriota bacterium]
MQRWWQARIQRARKWLEWRVRERVTMAGLIFVVALSLTGFAAFASANNLLFLLLAAMIATMLVSSFVSRIGIAGLELDVQLPDHICARREVGARIILKNEKGWMPSFSIRLVGLEGSVFTTDLYFPVLPGGGACETTVDVRFDRRGLHSEDSFMFSSRFPFGFAERRARVTMKHDVLVYPALEPQPGFERLLAEVAGEADSRFRGRGHDFYRIRPYEALESARHVDWRATAHTGELQVREFAREEEHLITLFLDLEVPREHEEWFERALECCAFLAWRFSERGARVRFRTQDFDLYSPVEGDVYVILKYLALVECRHRAAPVRNLEEESVAIVFSASPARLQDCGWNGARLLEPGTGVFAADA